MTSDRSESAAPARKPEEGSPFAILATDFVEVLALFVRTIPLYPDGHSRVVAVSDRLEETAEALAAPVVIEVAERGLIVDGKPRPELPPGPKALRDALLATAVSRVVFQPTTPGSSYSAFARSLQRNARLAQHSHLGFADLWMSPIPGIGVEELVFGAEGFVEGDGADAPPDGSAEEGPEESRVLGSGSGDGSGIGGGAVVPGSVVEGAGSGVATPLKAETPAPVEKPRRRVLRMHTVAPELRELALADRELLADVTSLADGLAHQGAIGSSSGADVLEHLVRALPIEARLDPEKGVKLLRKIVERLRAKSVGDAPGGERADLASRFSALLARVFPRRMERIDEKAVAAEVEALPSAESFNFDELLFLDDSLLHDLGGGDDEGPPPVPELSADVGIDDPSALLLHALLEEPSPERRLELHRRLIESYAARPKGAPPPCLVRHLTEAVAAAPGTPEAEPLGLLASIADEARIEFRPGASPITADVAVSLFPVGLGAHLRCGGRAGGIARRIGREAVLAAAEQLVTPPGALTGETLDRILAERSTDVLPFVEALLVASPAGRGRALRALRALDLKSLAAVALRIVPEERFSSRFLEGLCADGFAGVDSRHFVPEAAVALGHMVVDKEGALDVKTRSYAIAALSSFPFEFAEAPLRAVAARRLIGSAPKELRRAAETILKRLARDAALARPIP